MKRTLALVALFVFALSLSAYAVDAQGKTGKISAVDAAAKTLTVEFTRPLTISVNDTTKITLDGKDSTFADAVKVGSTATVVYAKEGDKRVASKIDVKTAAEPKKEAK